MTAILQPSYGGIYDWQTTAYNSYDADVLEQSDIDTATADKIHHYYTMLHHHFNYCLSPSLTKNITHRRVEFRLCEKCSTETATWQVASCSFSVIS